ncbi:molybdenum cofactor cytidylyltransferase [Ferrimonas aestuarii]|uniref:Molybdenum cofactor cytidylyltransferase n=2 Tax=Ferrimonas aestuarii TaxID=2569539 RepID=A0A4V6WMR4_9GAMM|nr:molybdenum cofactor cytidylyltransferase [Ferrimonas aestuarii]
MDASASVDCVITAAGLSSRMGQWKMMLPYGDRTILDTSIENALHFCSRVILVTGHNGEQLQQRYQPHPAITLIHNPEFKRGLFGSIQRGLAQVESEFCFIAHGDLPRIAPTTYHRLWQHRCQHPVMPSYQGEKGHPVLLPSTAIPSILAATANQQKYSMKWQLKQLQPKFVEVNDEGVLWDVDTPERYQELIKHHNANKN